MNTRTGAYIQAIRGPVLLVTIGVLFAIHQAGIMSFSRTWPLLIIVIGVMKLWERSVVPLQPFPGSPSGTSRSPGARPYSPQSGSNQQYTGPTVPPGNSGGNNA